MSTPDEVREEFNAILDEVGEKLDANTLTDDEVGGWVFRGLTLFGHVLIGGWEEVGRIADALEEAVK